MKQLVFMAIFLSVVGCANKQPQRRPSSESLFRFGEVDAQKSRVQIFPAVISNKELVHYFYLQLKDREGKFIDCESSEISLVTHSGQPIPFEFERLLAGRYYVTVKQTSEVNFGELNFFIRDKLLKEQFKLYLKKPDKSHTQVFLVKNDKNKMTLRLRLADKSNRPVALPDTPEVLLDGLGFIEELKLIDEGIWEFSVIYPEQNQIMYFSIRAHGAYFERIFRYHHVEK